MKQYLFTIVATLFSLITFSQKQIEVFPEKVNIENRKFYVSKIIDKRENKEFVGEYQKDSIVEKITIKNGVLRTFGEYFQRNLTKKTNSQIPIIVHINSIIITEVKKNDTTFGIAKITLTFIKENGDAKTISSSISEKTNNAFATHEKRTRQALLDCIIKYNETINTDEYEIISDEDAIEINFDKEDTSPKKYKKENQLQVQKELENVTTVGYQIGGMTLLGIDYERRITKVLGVHAGVGLLGYTIGAKIHTKAKQNSLFLNASWKDAGLGIINGFALEAGSRWIWSKKRNFGLLYQGGIIIYNHIDDSYVKDFFGGEKPVVSLMLGVGLSW